MDTTSRRLAPLGIFLAIACSSLAAAALAPARQNRPAQARQRAAVRTELAAHREKQLARLHAYGLAGQFPHNYTAAPELHIFRDAEARLCGVANLVHRDGRDDLVNKTVRENNELAIADVHQGPMLQWILTSGLTQEELVRIQAPAPRVMRPQVRPPPALVAQQDARPALSEIQLRVALRRHVAAVEAKLRADSATSLEVAVDRYLAARSPRIPSA
jgi:hypothetical protein